LLYEQGFTISGARNQLVELGVHVPPDADELDPEMEMLSSSGARVKAAGVSSSGTAPVARALQVSSPAMADAAWVGPDLVDLQQAGPEAVLSLREALLSIRDLLS
jgi:hypothetical protein